MADGAEYWYDETVQVTAGTWQGIQRSQTPMWRSQLWTIPEIPQDQVYFISSQNSWVFQYPSQCVRMDGIGVPTPIDPDMILPEGF